MENQLTQEFIKVHFFSSQLDESTDVQGLCQLLVFVHYVRNSEPYEDMLFCQPVSQSTGDEICKTIDSYAKTKGLDWNKCVGICTDGTQAMYGVVTKILELNPNISWTHCSLHTEALVSKCLSGDLKNVLNTSIKIVNFIKSKPLQSHLFEKLCKEMGSNHKSLLLHTEVHWLSRGKVLT